MSNNSNFYAFHPRDAIKVEEEAASVSKKQECLHHEVTYFLLNKISRGYDNQLGSVLRYYSVLWRHHQHFNKQILRAVTLVPPFAIIYYYFYYYYYSLWYLHILTDKYRISFYL